MQDKAIALCRVSTAEQRTEGHSLERQNANVDQFAEDNNLEIIKRWSLDTSSKSGKNFNRKDLLEIISFLKSHKNVKILLVDEIDRFMRSIEEFWYFIGKFKFEFGVRVLFVSQPELNEDDDMSLIQKNFDVMRSHLENSKRAEKSKNGLMSRVALGYSPFNVKQGYKKTDIPGLHKPDPVRFPLLQSSMYKILKDGYSPAEALRFLTRNGYTTPAGNLLDIDHYMKILRCAYYAGALWIKDWPRCDKGLHKPMITLSEWELLQELISRRKPKFERKIDNPLFPMSKSVCECGGKLTGFEHRNGKGWVGKKYRCRGCKKQYRSVDIHKNMDNLLTKIDVSKESSKVLVAALKKVWNQRQVENISIIKMLERRSDELKTRKNQLVVSLGEHPELAIDTKEAIEAIKAEISENQHELERASDLQEDLVNFVEFSLTTIQNLSEKWWGLEQTDRLKCKQLLFPKDFYIKKTGKVYTPEISPIIRLLSNKKGSEIASESLLVEQIQKNLHPILENVAYWRDILTPEYNRWSLNAFKSHK